MDDKKLTSIRLLNSSRGRSRSPQQMSSTDPEIEVQATGSVQQHRTVDLFGGISDFDTLSAVVSNFDQLATTFPPLPTTKSQQDRLRKQGGASKGRPRNPTSSIAKKERNKGIFCVITLPN